MKSSALKTSSRGLGPFHACTSCGEEKWRTDGSAQEYTKISSTNQVGQEWSQLMKLAAGFVQELDSDMRAISLALHEHPELGFHEV